MTRKVWIVVHDEAGDRERTPVVYAKKTDALRAAADIVGRLASDELSIYDLDEKDQRRLRDIINTVSEGKVGKALEDWEEYGEETDAGSVSIVEALFVE